jgi:hypothetical protein
MIFEYSSPYRRGGLGFCLTSVKFDLKVGVWYDGWLFVGWAALTQRQAWVEFWVLADWDRAEWISAVRGCELLRCV